MTFEGYVHEVRNRAPVIFINGTKLIFVVIVLMTILVGLYQSTGFGTRKPAFVSKFDVDMDIATLQDMLHERAINRTVLISILDSGFLDMALNLWETSYVRFNITNYLFICLSEKAWIELAIRNISCFVYTKKFVVDSATFFGQISYNKKVMLKTQVSLQILMLGYNALTVDLDIVFFENPMPYMQCGTCDLIITDNASKEVNSGFYLMKANKIGIAVQQKALQLARGSLFAHDQLMLNTALTIFRARKAIKMEVLDVHKFQPGKIYFEPADFASQVNNTGIVLVHDNWIIGIENKIYRLKEMLLWDVDTDGYYSSETTKYLTYKVPVNATKYYAYKTHSFATQLAKALKRVVILPKFSCKKDNSTEIRECNFNSFFGHLPQESAVRESEFLNHHKVPESVKMSLSPVIHFDNSGHPSHFDTNSILFKLGKEDNINSLVQKLDSLGVSSYKVLQFGFLNGVAYQFQSASSFAKNDRSGRKS